MLISGDGITIGTGRNWKVNLRNGVAKRAANELARLERVRLRFNFCFTIENLVILKNTLYKPSSNVEFE